MSKYQCHHCGEPLKADECVEIESYLPPNFGRSSVRFHLLCFKKHHDQQKEQQQ